ncbi:hypothetical protein ASG83_02360 [Yonghaparkia sp. Soil809]|nr:hypothetical protein ASG83_02360 [Yonghaparkia sp. Soil809]
MPSSRRERTGRIVAAAIAIVLAASVVPGGPPASATHPPAPIVADPLPSWRHGGVITDPVTIKWKPNPTNYEYIFPGVIETTELENPLGRYYLYTAPHDRPGGIILLYSDSLEGPWTQYGSTPLIDNRWEKNDGSGQVYYDVDHVSGPDPIWNPTDGLMYLYFHGENYTTRWATSSDGITFTYGGEALNSQDGNTIIKNGVAVGETITERSYGRVFVHPAPTSQVKWGMLYMDHRGDPTYTRRVRLAESADGRNWTVRPDFVITGDSVAGAQVSGGNLWTWNGQNYVVYHGSNGKTIARTVNSTFTDIGEPIVLHESTGISGDVGGVKSPEIITDETGTYLFYTGNQGGAGTNETVRWAKLDPSAPLHDSCPGTGSDEFRGSALGSSWTVTNRAGVATAHRVEGGELVIPTYAAGVAGAPLVQRSLPSGAWEYTAEVRVDPQTAYQQGGILLHGTDSTYAKLALAQSSSGERFEFTWRKNGTEQSIGVGFAPSEDIAGEPVWLRLVSDGSSVRARYSTDGDRFQPLGGAVPLADIAATRIGPVALQGATGGAATEASFRWARFTPSDAQRDACALGGPTAASAGSGSDEFAAASLSSSTWPIRPSTSTYRLENGQLVMPTVAAGISGAPLLAQPVPASAPWAVTTRIQIDPTQPFQQGGLLLRSDGDDYAKLVLGRASAGLVVDFAWRHEGVDRPSTSVDTRGPGSGTAAGFWLRLSSDERYITASISHDGVLFTPMGRRIPVEELPLATIGPVAIHGATAASPTDARFDWFRWRSPGR